MQGFYNRLVFMVGKSMHTLSLVEEEGFIEIVRYLDPNIRMPCRFTLTTKLLPDCYLRTKKPTNGRNWRSRTHVFDYRLVVVTEHGVVHVAYGALHKFK